MSRFSFEIQWFWLLLLLTLDDTSAQTCKFCRCSAALTTCRGTIPNFPTGLPNSTEHLYVAGTIQKPANIHHPQTKDLVLPNLLRLYIKYSFLDKLESNIFLYTKDLKSLTLSNNKLSKLPSGIFNSLRNLTLLDLSHNSIVQLSDLFSGLTSLLQLNLGGNQIESISLTDFKDLSNLSFLDLHGNRITSVDSNTFSNSPLLLYLDLSFNDMTVFIADLPAKLTQNGTIHLQGNRWRCNCNMHSILSLGSRVTEPLHNSRLFCSSPNNLTAIPISQVTLVPCVLPVITCNKPGSVKLGEALNLQCSISASEPRPAIKWKLPDGSLAEVGRTARADVTPGGSLTINSTLLRDNGDFLLTASGVYMGKLQSFNKVVKVMVLAPTTTTKTTTTTTATTTTTTITATRTRTITTTTKITTITKPSATATTTTTTTILTTATTTTTSIVTTTITKTRLSKTKPHWTNIINTTFSSTSKPSSSFTINTTIQRVLDSSSNSIGAIVGGIVAVLVAAIVTVITVVLLRKRATLKKTGPDESLEHNKLASYEIYRPRPPQSTRLSHTPALTEVQI